jgi:hypothetical protein
MMYRVFMAIMGTITTLIMIGCIAGWIYFLPPDHTPGSAQAVQDLHKWVAATIVSAFLSAVFWEEAGE